MVSVSLEGNMGLILGKKWNLHVRTVGEAVRALASNAGSRFKRGFGTAKGYIAVVDGVPVESGGWAFKKIKKSLLFIPVLAGGAVFIPALFEALFVALEVYMAAQTAQAIAAAIVILVLALIAYGMYSLIIAMMHQPQPGEGEATVSFIFAGPQNVASQGNVVPVAYGRMRTGSRVISVSATNVDKAIWEKNSLSDLVGGKVVRPVVGVIGGGDFGGGIGIRINLP